MRMHTHRNTNEIANINLHINEAIYIFCSNAATSLVVSDFSNSVDRIITLTLSQVLHSMELYD